MDLRTRLAPKTQLIRNRFAYVGRALRLIWTAAPRLTLAWGGLLVLQGLLPTGLVYLTKLLIDSLVAAIDASGAWQPVLIAAGLMAALMLLNELLRSISDWVRTAQAQIVEDHIKNLIHHNSTAVDLAFYEWPEYYDRLHQAQSDASGRPMTLLESTGTLLQQSITALGMVAVLLPFGLWAPVAMLISTLPALAVVFRFNRRFHRWWEQRTVDRRWLNYYDTMLTGQNSAAELRLFELGAHFQSGYQTLRRQLLGERLAFTRDQGLARVAAATLAGLISGLALLWMAWQAFLGGISPGELVMFFQAFNGGQGLLRTLLSQVGQIYSSSLFLENLFDFLALEPAIADPPQPVACPDRLQQGLRFRNVTFCYPGSRQPALQNFNLTIPAGQVVALVGANGAGKSTVVKLLCRFYDPQEGAIELDGIDLRRLRLAELRRRVTALFQFPVPYQATAGQNIALGDLAARPAAAEIERAARGAGAHDIIQNLPQGYDTLLGKAFVEGTELSGGEWQRVALARAFLRQAPLVILDEPTSFMDSWSETDWLARFKSLVAGQTAVIVTHRFTTAMQADMIHVMERGQIVESGSHAELMALEGRYAQSWTAQMQAGAGIAPSGTPTGQPQNGRGPAAPWPAGAAEQTTG